MSDVTTTAQVLPGQDTYYDRVLLEQAKPWLVHGMFAQDRPIPQKGGRTAKFRKYTAFAIAIAPLTEGVTPEGKQLAVTDITATLSQYGDWTSVSDVLTWVGQDAVLTEAVELLGDQAGETIDTVHREKLNAGSSVRRANGVSLRTDIVAKIADVDIKYAERALLSAKARIIADSVRPSTGVGTSPLGPSYMAICHTDTLYDLQSLTGWVNVYNYPSASQYEMEAGFNRKIRFLMTQNAKIWADGGGSAVAGGLKYTTASSACDVYSTIVMGKNSYGKVPLTGKSMESIIQPLGSAGVGGPLKQWGTAAWKAMITGKILNETWILRVEHGVTA